MAIRPDKRLTGRQQALVLRCASRQTKERQNHVRIGIANGLNAREIEEVLIQCVPYAGFPAATSATSAVVKLCAKWASTCRPAPLKSRVSSDSSHPFKHGGQALATAYTHGLQSVTSLAALQLVQHGGQYAHAGGTDGMPQRNPATVHI